MAWNFPKGILRYFQALGKEEAGFKTLIHDLKIFLSLAGYLRGYRENLNVFKLFVLLYSLILEVKKYREPSEWDY